MTTQHHGIPAAIGALLMIANAETAALNAPHTEPIPPKWALGYMQSWWGSTFNDEGYGSQQGFIDHARALRGLPNQFGIHQHPADVMVLDMHWNGGNWDWPKSMQWARDKYPDPKKMIDSLHAMHFKIMMNYHAMTGVTAEWIDSLKRDLNYGLDVPWLDFWYMDAEEARIHDTLVNHRGNKREVMMLRHYARPNSQSGEANRDPSDPNTEKAMAFHWTGDVNGNWQGLQESIEAIVYGPNGAFGGWSYLHADCPGHLLMPDLELASRWIQFSDFTAMTRNHGTEGGRDVWSWGVQGEENSKFSRMLRYRLLPYIYTYCRQIWDTGYPLTRPMRMAYPADASALKYQYLFGRELLVAPVYTNANQYLPVYLPKADDWADYWTHTEYKGGDTVKVDIKKDNCKYVPLFVKKGSIIPMGPEIWWIDPKVAADPITLDIYPKADSALSFSLYDDDGETKDYQSGSHGFTAIQYNGGSAGQFTACIGAMEGTYTGRPANRTWIFKINLCPSPPASVYAGATALQKISDPAALLSGTQTSGWAYDATSRILYARAKSPTTATLVLATQPTAAQAGTIRRTIDRDGGVRVAMRVMGVDRSETGVTAVDMTGRALKATGRTAVKAVLQRQGR